MPAVTLARALKRAGHEPTLLTEGRAVENALLCGHDLIFLGERGQAKSRLIRSLVGLLDEWVPAVAGSEICDDPLAPVSAFARRRVAANRIPEPPAKSPRARWSLP